MDGLTTLIYWANWGIVASLLGGLVCTAATVIAGKELDALREQRDLAQQERIEAMRRGNLELEQSLKPRRFPLIVGPGGSNFDSLKPFAGMLVIVQYIPDDAEARRAAGMIGLLVKEAGWTVVSEGPSPKAGSDGVSVEQYLAPTPNAHAFATDERRSYEAAQALVNFLHSYDWEAETGMASRHPIDAIAPNTVRVRVGLKPLPFFASEGQKRAKQDAQRTREQIKDRERKP